MPSSYGIHPILNIAHLEKYQSTPTEFGERPVKNLNREDFNNLPEYEVERIITEWKKKGRNGRWIIVESSSPPSNPVFVNDDRLKAKHHHQPCINHCQHV